ncbi:MAG TPA: efflux RND transporter periplasmic adaptor subunit, partial [Steroidobacteraceae bacterium]|nr:efflux RND transporter periplasmic adaptor subunit [Steroidobacteraceae bacterium]
MHICYRLLIVAALTAAAACSQQTAPTADAAPSSTDTDAALPEDAGRMAAVSPQIAKQVGIETDEAKAEPIRTTLTLFGSIQTEPQNVAEVTARYPGVIRSVLHQIGDRVSAEEPLAKVESNESLQVYAVTAPIAGVITQRHANPGEVAGAEPLFEVVDTSKVRVDLSVFPQDRAKLKVGQKVRVTSTDANTQSEGTLAYISPVGSAQTQSVIARVSLDNRAGHWAPGQFVTADVLLDESTAQVAVQPTAIQQVKGQPVVFVQSQQGFTARPIEIGRRSNDAIEIKQGLQAGERYAATNTFLLKAELLKSEAEED